MSIASVNRRYAFVILPYRISCGCIFFSLQFQRVGRGPGSHRGKTCGRGHKGQVGLTSV